MILSKLEIDYLKELTTICVGSVANRMATIVPFPVMISLPSLTIITNYDESSVFSTNSYKYSIHIRGEGDFSAHLIISLSPTTPAIIIQHNPYMSEFADSNDPTFIESMVLEMGNILSSAYMTAIEQFTGLCLMPTVPSLVHNGSDVISSHYFQQNSTLAIPFILLQADLLLTFHRERAFFATLLSEEQVRLILRCREEN